MGIKTTAIFIPKKNKFENIVCKMAAILFQPQMGLEVVGVGTLYGV